MTATLETPPASGTAPPEPRPPRVLPPRWGLVLGVLVYPVVLLAARYYVRHSEQLEREFVALVERR